MILKGKCKEAFFKNVYFSEDCTQVNENLESEILEEASVWLSNQDERFRNALIVEFFDSVGIYIESEYWAYGEFRSAVQLKMGKYESTCVTFNTRLEATEAAIIKANDIWNERHT